MLNYTHEVIVNDSENLLNQSKLGTGSFGVKRGGNYLAANVVDSKVYKTSAVEGKCAVVTITPLSKDDADLYRYAIHVTTPSVQLVEYAYPNWREFGKPILVETASTTAAGVAAAFKLALQEDNKLYSVEVSGSTVVLTFTESWIKVDSASAEYHVASDSVAGGVWTVEESSTAADIASAKVITLTTANVVEFGTAKWLVENLRLPTTPNLRYARLYADEAPIKGALYVEYSFEYKVSQWAPGGLSGVGQVVDSITRHIFYVHEDVASAFETMLTAEGNALTIDSTSYKA